MFPAETAFLASAPRDAGDSPAARVPAAAPHSLLLVEDDKDIRDLLSDALATEGYDVVCARHGAEALERLGAFHPDLILLDLMMPVMDGVTFIAAKRCDPVLADIPVIAMTAASRSTVEGAIALLRKPFDLDVLLADVARCLRDRSAG